MHAPRTRARAPCLDRLQNHQADHASDGSPGEAVDLGAASRTRGAGRARGRRGRRRGRGRARARGVAARRSRRCAVAVDGIADVVHGRLGGGDVLDGARGGEARGGVGRDDLLVLALARVVAAATALRGGALGDAGGAAGGDLSDQAAEVGRGVGGGGGSEAEEAGEDDGLELHLV